jgi:UDP-glucose 4-epimerase
MRSSFKQERLDCSPQYQDKIVAITGGTGSFGQTVARHLLAKNIGEIRVVSRDEAKQDAMRHDLADARVKFFIADVRDRTSLIDPFRGADWIFHAAALKQVPSCEFFPEQAVRTNVLGSENVILEATAQNVAKVVFLSTDKAVQPLNAMGLTKALMEKLVHAHARRLGSAGPSLCCVRYGNVLYSRGSVIPLFVDRIIRGMPLPVTAPQMTRFLLPLSETVNLISLALEEGRSGDLFVRKSPAATVATLADALLAIFQTQLPIEVIGIRHGEKIHETLVTGEEMSRADDLGDYLRIPMDRRDLNYREQSEPNRKPIVAAEDFTSENAIRLDREGAMAMLMTIPEIRERIPE